MGRAGWYLFRKIDFLGRVGWFFTNLDTKFVKVHKFPFEKISCPIPPVVKKSIFLEMSHPVRFIKYIVPYGSSVVAKVCPIKFLENVKPNQPNHEKWTIDDVEPKIGFL